MRNFLQLSVQLGDFRQPLQLSVRPGDLPSTFFNLECGRETYCELPSTFRAAGRPCFNFYQHSMLLEGFPSTSLNFPCSPKTFRQSLVGQETICQFPSNFRVAGRNSLNFLQHSIRPVDLLSTSDNCPCSKQIFHHLPTNSVNFQCSHETFRELLSTFDNSGKIDGG